jgi:hypothetical protein
MGFRFKLFKKYVCKLQLYFQGSTCGKNVFLPNGLFGVECNKRKSVIWKQLEIKIPWNILTLFIYDD